MNHTNSHVCIVPSSAAMSRFIKKLKEHQEDLTEMMVILEKKYPLMGKLFKATPIKYLLKNQMAEEKRRLIRPQKISIQITKLKLRSTILVSDFIY